MRKGKWKFAPKLDDGGIILNDVTHGGFHCVQDIRVTRVWISSKYPDEAGFGAATKSYVLNKDLPCTTGSITDLTSPTAPVGNFAVYSAVGGLTATFANFGSSTPKFLEGEPNATDILVFQTYLFGNYGKHPPHEPGAVLKASRLFPMLRFQFPKVEHADAAYPKYFRADFRLEVNLDNIDEAGVVARKTTTDRLDKGAVFRDADDLTKALLHGAEIALGGPVRFAFDPPSIADLFDSFEKPLQYEIATWGLAQGPTPAGITKNGTWDDVHIWPAKRGPGGDPISTPGAFHALHCHWRWAAVAGRVPSALRPDVMLLLPAAGGQQFQGPAFEPGGPLISSLLPHQNLRFAITKSDAAWAAGANSSTEDFFSLFSSQRAKPDAIQAGENLVLWFSFEVFREDQLDDWDGFLFINGLYFAHSKDRTPLAARAGGAYDEGASPAAKQDWRRLPR